MSLRRKIVRVREPFDAAEAYSEDAIDAVIAAAGGLPCGEISALVPDAEGDALISKKVARREALRIKLITAGRWLAILGPREGQPTEAERDAIIARAAKAAHRLVAALHIRDTPHVVALPDWLDLELQAMAAFEAPMVGKMRGYLHEMPEGELLGESIDALMRLERWLDALTKRQRFGETRQVNRAAHARHRGSPARERWIVEMRIIWMEIFRRTDIHSRTFARFLVSASAPTPLCLTDVQALELRRN